MTSAASALLGLAAVAAVVDWFAVARGRRRLEYVAKPLTTALLIAVALVIDPSDPTQRTAFAIGLAASLAGDVALMLDRFIPGLTAFLVAHLAYIAGFLVRDLSIPLLAVGTVGVLVVAVPVGTRIVGALRSGPGRSLVGPVTAYMLIISAMVVVSVGTGLAWAVAGAASFYLSDALIGWHRFVRPLGWAPVAIMVTYHVGQALLIGSLTV